MWQVHAHQALDLANERTRELQRRRWDRDLLSPDPGPSLASRAVARAAVAVSRATAIMARRLDEHVFDDRLAPGSSRPIR